MTATTEEYRKIENWMKESLELVKLPLEYQYGDYDDFMFKAVTKKDNENLTLRFKNYNTPQKLDSNLRCKMN